MENHPIYCVDCETPNDNDAFACRNCGKSFLRNESQHENSLREVSEQKTFRPVLCVFLGAGVILVCVTTFIVLRNSGLRAKLSECSSRHGINVCVYYDNYISTSDVAFDLQGVEEGVSVRRVDLVHLLFQFSQLLDKGSTKRLIIARSGQKFLYLGLTDMVELANEYTYGNPVWSFHHLPERLKTMSGKNAYPTWDGGWLGVMKEQSEDLNKFISDWVGKEFS